MVAEAEGGPGLRTGVLALLYPVACRLPTSQHPPMHFHNRAPGSAPLPPPPLPLPASPARPPSATTAPCLPAHGRPATSALQTLCCANTVHDQLLQVTATAFRLVDCMTQQLVTQWEPGADGRITIAAASPTQVRAGCRPCLLSPRLAIRPSPVALPALNSSPCLCV